MLQAGGARARRKESGEAVNDWERDNLRSIMGHIQSRDELERLRKTIEECRDAISISGGDGGVELEKLSDEISGIWLRCDDFISSLSPDGLVVEELARLRHREVMLKRAHGALTDAGCVVPIEFDRTIEHAINALAERAITAEERLERVTLERDQERKAFDQAMIDAQTSIMELRARIVVLEAMKP